MFEAGGRISLILRRSLVLIFFSWYVAWTLKLARQAYQAKYFHNWTSNLFAYSGFTTNGKTASIECFLEQLYTG